jgi:hypothetical protein
MLVVMEVPGKRSPQASTTLEELRSSTCAVVKLGCSGAQGADVVRLPSVCRPGGMARNTLQCGSCWANGAHQLCGVRGQRCQQRGEATNHEGPAV